MVFIIRFLIPAAILWFVWRYFQEDKESLGDSHEGSKLNSEPEIVDLCPDCGELLKNKKNHKCS
ncbi:MAG: hypothetical protein AB8C84_05500 [Oligoflexales bacterium]